MSRTSGVLAAMKASPGRGSMAPQSGGWGQLNSVAAGAMYGNPRAGSGYGPFLPRPSATFSDGAFGPMSPIQPVPVDQPAVPGGFPDPRLWQYPVSWNLPTQPGTEGLKMASFQQLQTIAQRYSVARRCIQLRREEISGLEWSIEMTTQAAKAYQGDHKAMRDFGERAAKATKFFKKPDPDYWNFASWLGALLEEIFVFDALSLIFRPKYGKGLGRGLLGSDLDSISLVSGPTIRPLLGMHGEKPRPPAPAYQQFLFGVPRSDFQTIISGSDIDDYGLTGAEVNSFRADTMLYAPLVTRRETPYGFPPVEQALLPIISGLQKQEYQLSYYTEGCYSDDTEILTRSGWKLFAKLADEDEVATRSEDGLFQWQLPSARLEYPFDGEMVEFQNRYIDLLVTPGHRMLVRRPASYVRKQPGAEGQDWHIRLAEFFSGNPQAAWEVPATSEWRSAGRPAEFVLPDEDNGHGTRPGVRMPIEAFCAFLGVYLAEGCVHDRKASSVGRRRDVSVEIAQAPGSPHLAEIESTLRLTGLNWKYRTDGTNGRFYLASSAVLGRWLKDHCGHGSWNKQIPHWVKDLPVQCLENLLRGMMIGDGHWRKSGARWYNTSSDCLADDAQEIFQKLGRNAIKYAYAGKPNWKSKRNRPQFRVAELAAESGARRLPPAARREYHGTVHCVTVPNGIVLVRRNGKPVWCGNTVPAVYISPGDPNMTPTQVRELQDALNGIAGDPAYHLKVIVLPPGSKVEPQRPVDLADTFDTLVQTQVCMQLDVMPDELGLLPNVGSAGAGGSSNASALRFASGESRDPKSRKSTKPLLMTLCDIANYVLQGICGQEDMQFAFEGLAAEDDKQAIVDRGVQGIQNGLYSIDEVRGWLDLPPWGLPETSEPVVFTAQGPIPFSMAPEIIRAAITGNSPPPSGGQGTNSGQRSPSSRSRTSQPSVRQGGQTKPNGTHPAPVADHREAPLTPGHSAAAGAIQSPTPRTGGTTSRSSVAGSRKKAAEAELGALARHLRKGREITSWEARHIPARALSAIAEDIAKGVLIDTAVERAGTIAFAAGDVIDDGEAAAFKGPLGIGDEAERDVDAGKGVAGVKAAHWPGWERDLGLVGAYKNLIGQAFHDAEARGSALRKKAATGGMFVSNGVLRDLISDEVREVFTKALTPMWEEAWDLGYDSARELVNKGALEAAGGSAVVRAVPAEGRIQARQAFLDTEGEHWLSQVSRTGLGNNSARSELIARTEIARAINSAAIQCYRDHGVQYKHLLLSPGACDICKDAADDGDIPLDAPFSAGGVIGAVHPACRCAPGPAGVDVEPPLADLGKADGGSETGEFPQFEDESRAGFLMLRARHPDDGKWRYLLQQRDDGTWGLPGGSAHLGETARSAAARESAEEIGDLPPLGEPKAVCQFRDDRKTAWIHVHEVSFFQPLLNGSTPGETQGTGWFRRKEVGDLDLHPPFRAQWESTDWRDPYGIGKSQRAVNENGEVLTLTPASQRLQATGARWPYPHRADGTEDPEGAPGHVPGGTAGEMGAPEPPHWNDDMAGPGPHDTLEPRNVNDGDMPSRGRKPNPPADAFPDQGSEDDDAWPQPQATLQPPGSSIGARTGVPPSGKASGNDSGHPVVGAYKPSAPKPVQPGSVPPVTFDPATAIEDWRPEDDSDVVHDVGKGAQHVTDANPVEWRHVWAVMESQFPDSALQWVRHSTWQGPLNVPWSRIDDDAIGSWAASHQPGAVNRFAREIARGGRHTEPSILFHQANHPDGRETIADGHHRAMARHFKLRRPVLAYVGTVPARWMKQALETHSSQLHSGEDPANK